MVVGEALSSTVCLHRYPKSAIEVFVTVIEDNGGIHMFDIVVGSKVSLTRKEVVVVRTGISSLGWMGMRLWGR